jgi:hypothetical protein
MSAMQSAVLSISTFQAHDPVHIMWNNIRVRKCFLFYIYIYICICIYIYIHMHGNISLLCGTVKDVDLYCVSGRMTGRM